MSCESGWGFPPGDFLTHAKICYRISYKDHVTNKEVRAKIQQAIGPHEDLLTIRKETKPSVVWTCLPFIKPGQNHLAKHSEMEFLEGIFLCVSDFSVNTHIKQNLTSILLLLLIKLLKTTMRMVSILCCGGGGGGGFFLACEDCWEIENV